LQSRLLLASPVPSINTENPYLTKLVADYQAKYPGKPIDQGVLSGYITANIFAEALKAACKAGDLTPQGVVNAHRTNSTLQLGFGASLDFSSADKPPSYQTYILKVDKSKPSGLTTVEQGFEAPNAKQYPLPKAG
jgi:hypothetical protein